MAGREPGRLGLRMALNKNEHTLSRRMHECSLVEEHCLQNHQDSSGPSAGGWGGLTCRSDTLTSGFMAIDSKYRHSITRRGIRMALASHHSCMGKTATISGVSLHDKQ